MPARTNHPQALPLLAMLVVLLLSGCGAYSSGTTAAEPMIAAAPTAAPAAAEPSQALEAAAAEAPASGGGAPQQDNAAQPAATPIPQSAGGPVDPSRKIIKNADFTLEVESVVLGLNRIGDAAAQYGGYVIETRTDVGQYNVKTALLKVAVPVDRFEELLQRIRESAGKVLSEQASGVDVTQEFVDVQSQVANLEATQARIREFLERATSVEEALRVNAQLTEIEGQISQLKGRLQFLSQRAAYSTITVQMQEPPPVVTPEPTPAPPSWSAAQTAGEAYKTLVVIGQAGATLAIWFGVVVLPLLLPFALIALVWRVMRRRPVPVARIKGEQA